MSERCVFCHEEHPPDPVGIPEGPFPGVEIAACPKIPEGHLYIDSEHKHGPRGSLAAVPSESRQG